jgi:dipeptidyl aminopeptidase/acylaminoacyl peptidase
VLVSVDVFPDCASDADVLACTKKQLDARKADKASGTVYNSIFVRHWDTWADGRRSQLFIADLGADGKVGALKLLTKGIDGDVPSKPFGDDSEYAFSPDGATVYFDARIAGKSEPWSTNFDIYAVPADASAAPKNLTADNKAWDGYSVPSADGKRLYYLAMKRAGFEADRFGIHEIDLASGKQREVDPNWDRSAGGLQESADGKSLYATSDDWGDHALFSIDVASGKASSSSPTAASAASRSARTASSSRATTSSVRPTCIAPTHTAKASSRSRTSTRPHSRISASANRSSSPSRVTAATPCRVTSCSRSATRRARNIQSRLSCTAARKAR